MRNEIRETKIKYSFFRLICTMNQLIRFNINHVNYQYVYLANQGLYYKKKVKIVIF